MLSTCENASTTDWVLNRMSSGLDFCSNFWISIAFIIVMALTDLIKSVQESIITVPLGRECREHCLHHIFLARSRCKMLFELYLNHIFAAALLMAPRDKDSSLAGQYLQLLFARLPWLNYVLPTCLPLQDPGFFITIQHFWGAQEFWGGEGGRREGMWNRTCAPLFGDHHNLFLPCISCKQQITESNSSFNLTANWISFSAIPELIY